MMSPRLALAAVVAFASACSTSSSTPQPAADAAPTPGPTAIQIDNGMLQGKLVDNARAFLGIPFAAPPVGDLRWKPPAPAAAWTGTRDAIAYGHDCPQYDLVKATPLADPVEDCLYLNVWTPLATPSAPAPVMVFLHGGGFVIGSGSGATYDGTTLAGSNGVVVVTLNYRLGPLGFLGHTAFADGGAAAAPPHGLLDQRAALTWVKRNIAAFGGDASRVTIFGESAGGTSVCAQLAMPGSRGLFARAIMESGGCEPSIFVTSAKAKTQSDDFAKALGCTDVATAAACMRGKTAVEVLAALPVRKALFGKDGYTWSPIVDGVELPMTPNDALDAGMGAGVPLLLGSNKDEGNLFTKLWTLAFNHDITEAEIADLLPLLYTPAQITEIFAQYPLASYAGPPEQGSAMLTDSLFACSTRHTARATSSHGVPTFLYQFTRAFPTPLFGAIGAAHSFELPFVFHTSIGGKNVGDDEDGLSRTMMGYWTRFAATGDPNGGGAPVWPKYDAAGDTNIVLDDTVTTSNGLKKAACDFWDTHR